MGRPGGHQTPESDFPHYDAAILRVVREELGLRALPVVSHMDFGHTDPMVVLPYGVRATLDCPNHTLAIHEGAVV